MEKYISFIVLFLSVVLNVEAIIRQVAFNRGDKNVVSWCDHIASVVTFIIKVAEDFLKSNFNNTVPIVLMYFGLLFSAGCASAVLKSGCGHLTGSEITIPYVGGKANGNAYGCYMACAGAKCGAPDWNALSSLNAAYLTTAAKDNTIKTIDGGYVTYTPASK